MLGKGWDCLCDKNEEDENQACVGTVYAKHSFEWDLVQGVPLMRPCFSEADGVLSRSNPM
jgi:hypothetical protein